MVSLLQFLQLPQFSSLLFNLNQGHLKMGPSIPMREISTEMVRSFPGVDILELSHSIIDRFYARRVLVKLISTQDHTLRKNPLLFQFPNYFFRLIQKRFGSLFYVISQFK